MPKTVRDFWGIVDWHTVFITLLALLVTWLCRRLNLIADLPTNLIGLAVIFPLGFLINSAYRRREDALTAFAQFNASCMALFYAYRDWSADQSVKSEGVTVLRRLMRAVANHLIGTTKTDDHTWQAVYQAISELSLLNERLRQVGVPANEISRANQYIYHLIAAFERMHMITVYRTPVALRAYSRLFLNLFPILFGPFFANVAYPAVPAAGYAVAAIYAVVLVSLDNILDNLDHPFDGRGADDIRLEMGARSLELAATEMLLSAGQ